MEVGVVKVANGDGDEVDDEEFLDAEADHGEGQVLDAAVDDVLHPVVAELCGEAHLFDAMVDLVEFPEDGHAMEEPVNEVLQEVADDEHEHELCPGGQTTNLDGDEVLDAEGGSEEVIEGGDANHGETGEADGGEKEEVEEHVECIEPEVLADTGLVDAPWFEEFKGIDDDGGGNEPVEVVGSVGIGDLAAEVFEVTP